MTYFTIYFELYFKINFMVDTGHYDILRNALWRANLKLEWRNMKSMRPPPQLIIKPAIVYHKAYHKVRHGKYRKVHHNIL